MSKSPYALFGTDPDLETKGVVVDYGAFAFRLARAGGANKRFQKLLEARQKPYARQIQNGTLDETVALRLLAEVYAETIILDWGHRREPDQADCEIEWGHMPDPDGNLQPLTKPNAVKLLTDLPDLFGQLRVQASDMAVYRRQEIEDAVGNSATG